MIKLGFLDLRELAGARQNDIIYLLKFKTLLQPVNAAYLLGKTQLIFERQSKGSKHPCCILIKQCILNLVGIMMVWSL